MKWNMICILYFVELFVWFLIWCMALFLPSLLQDNKDLLDLYTFIVQQVYRVRIIDSLVTKCHLIRFTEWQFH